MARWKRDPKIRGRILFLIALVEVLAVSGNFFFIFSCYFWWVCVRVLTAWRETAAPLVVPAVVTGLLFVVLVWQGVVYAKGRVWPRRAFIIENLVVILMGLGWFVASCGNPEGPRGAPVFSGLLVPMVTLFPLLWPLWSFRREPPAHA